MTIKWVGDEQTRRVTKWQAHMHRPNQQPPNWHWLRGVCEACRIWNECSGLCCVLLCNARVGCMTISHVVVIGQAIIFAVQQIDAVTREKAEQICHLTPKNVRACGSKLWTYHIQISVSSDMVLVSWQRLCLSRFYIMDNITRRNPILRLLMSIRLTTWTHTFRIFWSLCDNK